MPERKPGDDVRPCHYEQMNPAAAPDARSRP